MLPNHRNQDPGNPIIQLNLQDPDSMTLDPFGDIVLDRQADQQLIMVTNPSTAKQQAIKVPLSFQPAEIPANAGQKGES
jgi:hypothetical protein